MAIDRDSRGPRGEGARRGRRRRRPDRRGARRARPARPRAHRAEAGRRALSGSRSREAVFRRLDPQVGWRPAAEEGRWREEPIFPRRSSSSRAMRAPCSPASASRSTSSGISRASRRSRRPACRSSRGTGVEVLDTRKTTPGLRSAGEARRRRGRGAQPPHGPLRRDARQGEPHRAGRRRRRGDPASARAAAAGLPGRGGMPDARRTSRRRSRRAPTGSCSTTWLPPICAAPSEVVGGAREARGVGRNETGITQGGRRHWRTIHLVGGADTFGARARPLYDAGGALTSAENEATSNHPNHRAAPRDRGHRRHARRGTPARHRAQGGDPRAQLPGARGPGRRGLRRRLARAVAPGGRRPRRR